MTTKHDPRVLSDEELRMAAVEYVATHKHDYAQIYTNPDCQIFRGKDDVFSVQVWVGLTEEVEIPEW